MKKLVRLFCELFGIALFVVGGGYAIIAVADETFSKKLKWTEEGELTEQLPLFQMIPGIMAAHSAVYLGRKVAGVGGACVGLLAVALPSVLIFSAVSMGYDAIPLDNRWLLAAFEGLRAALTGIIFAMVVRSGPKSVKGWKSALGCALALAALFAPCIPVVGVILFAIAFALVRTAGGARRKRLGGDASPYQATNPNTQTPKHQNTLPPPTATFRSAAWLAPLVFLKYGLVAFGGGYVLVPMYLQDFVGAAAPYLQIPAEEFANLMALTQMTPGPIGINAATFFGYRLFGFGGALVTTACLLIPGALILLAALRSLERFRENAYVKGVMACIKPVTLAMMLSALWSFAGMSLWSVDAGGLSFHPFSWLLFALVATLTLLRKLSAVQLILLSAGLSLALEGLQGLC